MNNKKLTAIEWFNQQLVDRQNGNGDSRSWDEIFEQAKELEKEQIIDACDTALRTDFYVKYYDSEQYYYETYNS